MKKWLPFIGACIIGLAIFLLAENKVAQSFQQCVTDERGHQSANNSNKSRFIIGRAIEPQFVCSVEFLDSHSGFVAALAGIAVALFTYTLYTASIEQAGLTRDSITLARDEFLATHRPKIVIHAIEFSNDISDSPAHPNVGASITYFNKGRSEAVIVEIQAVISGRGLPLQSGIILPTIQTARVVVPVGMPGTFIIGSEIDDRHIRLLEGGQAVVCAGVIIYEDAKGNRRRTAFCRQFVRQMSGRPCWVEMDEPEYEYAY